MLMRDVLRVMVRTILIERLAPNAATRVLLQKVDDGPYHMLPIDELDPDELKLAGWLEKDGLVRRLPANDRFPERFVLTGPGSHATGTFDMDTYHDEKPGIRAARRMGTLKSKKW